MNDTLRTTLTEWESFYVIVGSSGAALTGLQFVVMTLISESRVRRDGREVEAFGTPTVVHFGAVLLVSAILSAPWRRVGSVAAALIFAGMVGALYTTLVAHRARSTRYQPVAEDWVFHVCLPFLAYIAIAGAGVAFVQAEAGALFAVAAAVLALLFVGIHNAWDTVTFIATGQLEEVEGGVGRPGPEGR